MNPMENDNDFWTVFPIPGYVLKFKEAIYNNSLTGREPAKCFVNVCHCKQLPEPTVDLDENQLAARIDAEDFTYRVPLSVGEIDIIKDNKNSNAMKVDVIVNSTFYQKRLAPVDANFFRHYICMVLCDAIENKHKIELSPNDAIRLGRTKIGTIEPMRIYKKPKVGDIISEVSTADASSSHKADNTERFEEDGAIGCEQPKGVTMRWLKGEVLELRLELPEHVDSKERLLLTMKSDRLQLTMRRSHSLFDFHFPVLIDPSTARCKFNVDTQVMTICAKTVFP